MLIYRKQQLKGSRMIGTDLIVAIHAILIGIDAAWPGI